LSPFIPEEKIEEVKNAADIVDIISDYVLLKKTGQNYSGLCPFHSEKTPSFTVSPSKQIFHCFGCNTGGNVFTVLMKHDGLSFPEAVRELAKRFSVTLPEKPISGSMRRMIDEREHLLAINRMAMAFYRRILLESPRGEAARQYIRRRQLSKSIVQNFGLGYAPPGWNSLLNYLLHKKIPIQLVEKSGLIIPKKSKNGFYDRFRDRIMFPIVNLQNQVIGFGGRVLDDSLPKYLNSPETPVYNKSTSLYGLNRGKEKCRETRSVFIVEGYFDLLALHRHGIDNSAATLGTALTEAHIRILKGFVESVFLVFDADDAGIKASLRGVGIFIKAGMDARIVLLPQGHDPDSYLAEFGPEAFRRQAESSLDIISFLIQTAEKKHGLSVRGKMKIIDDLTMYLSSIEEDVRSLYIRELSERLSVEEYIIIDKVRQLIRSNTGIQARQRLGPAASPDDSKEKIHLANTPVPDNKKKVARDRLERQILSMMMQFPEILPEIVQTNVLDYFTNETLKSLGKVILAQNQKGDGQLSNLMSIVDDDEKRNILASLAFKEDLWNRRDCRKVITKLVQRSPIRYSLSLNEQIKAAEKENNQPLLLKLLRMKQDLAVSNEMMKRKISNDIS
jgi:DNA primase